MFLRTISLLTIVGSITMAAPRHRDWHTGQLDPITSVYMDRNGSRTTTDQADTPSFDTATISLTIRTSDFVYRAEERVATTGRAVADDAAGRVTLRKSVDARQAVPWTRNLPAALRFAIEGKTLYYLDAHNKEHRTKLLWATPINH